MTATLVFLILALAALQLVPAALLVRATLRSAAVSGREPGSLPRTLVILCLRGADPELRACLEALLAQDHPDYRLHIVIDSDADPAWPLVRAHSDPRIAVETLQHRLPGASLKCAAQVQVLRALAPDVQAVVFVDSDAVPGRDWLRRLVEPLRDPRVGAVSGSRWFSPAQPQAAALIRGAWNGICELHRYWLGIAWGGSLAVRRELVTDSGLIEHWSQAFGEDTSINAPLRELGLGLRFVPSLIMFNDGACDRASAEGWLERQLLSARLHHRSWPLIVAYALGGLCALFIAVLLAAGLLLTGDTRAALPLLAALATYEILQVVLLLTGDAVAARCADRAPPYPAWRRIARALQVLAVLPGAQWGFGRALLRVLRAREMAWRGIVYDLPRGGGLRLRAYRPFTGGR